MPDEEALTTQSPVLPLARFRSLCVVSVLDEISIIRIMKLKTEFYNAQYCILPSRRVCFDRFNTEDDTKLVMNMVTINNSKVKMSLKESLIVTFINNICVPQSLGTLLEL